MVPLEEAVWPSMIDALVSMIDRGESYCLSIIDTIPSIIDTLVSIIDRGTIRFIDR